MKSFWYFHLEDTDEFDVKKLKYSEFLVPKERDKKAAEYQELKSQIWRKKCLIRPLFNMSKKYLWMNDQKVCPWDM